EPMGQFDMWRDYLGLADMVATLFRDHEDLEDPSALPDPLAPRARTAPRAWPASCARTALRAGGLPPCSFCQHNGEAPKMYQSHSLRDAQGRLQCPVLRNYVCPQCGATQDRAHTRRYCPRTHRGYTSVYTHPAHPRSAGGRHWNT
ncbi:NANO3 protein, partial [Grantiella picta]|nr:NANO3 protein [Grantiella picta]